MSTSHYRERHSTSGAKSDPGDAKVLADLARTDAHNHRPIAGDSELAEALKVLARAHQSLIWTCQRQANQLRSTLREFYPGALSCFDDLYGVDALAVLAIAPTPSLGRRLSRSKIASALRRGGRQRRVEERAAEIQAALRSAQLAAPDLVAEAMGASVAALVAVAHELNAQIAVLEESVLSNTRTPRSSAPCQDWGRSWAPGCWLSSGMTRTAMAMPSLARTTPARHPPITKASGTRRVVLARFARNRRLADACHLWALATLTASPGARALYDERRAAGDTHHRALRALANRLVGILHGCLRHDALYDEDTAWAHRVKEAA
jgi:hypothetical protein